MSQESWSLTFLLHDAVYLYMRTANQTLAEGYPDFRNGRLIRNKTIGQRFAGKTQHRWFSSVYFENL